MDRLDKWAEINVIATYIGLGLVALIVLAVIVFVVWILIKERKSKK